MQTPGWRAIRAWSPVTVLQSGACAETLAAKEKPGNVCRYHWLVRVAPALIMGLDKADTVDAVGIERNSDFVALTIADGWDWHDEKAHLLALQAKLNAYFEFVESGQIYQSYPEASGRQVVIDVIGRFSLPQSGIELLTRASAACADLGLRICYEHHSGPKPQKP